MTTQFVRSRPIGMWLLLLLGLLGILYLIAVNTAATAMYELDALEQRVHEDRIVLEQLQLQISRERSPEQLFQRAVALGLVQPKAIEHLSTQALNVAIINNLNP